MSIVKRLEEIRSMQGLEPLPNPSIIQGAEHGFTPVPEFSPATNSSMDEDPDFGEELPEPPKHISPLVAAAQAPKPPQKSVEGLFPESVPQFQLAVFDSNAAYLGRSVVLSEKEQRAVTSVVLRALQRVVSQQLDELRNLAPRRKRHKSVEPVVLAQISDAPPKRRGRPKGSKNK